jgi:hypothetical protein
MDQRNILIGLGLLAAGGAAWWWWKSRDDDEDEIDFDTSALQPPVGADHAAVQAQIRQAFAAGTIPRPVAPAPAPQPAPSTFTAPQVVPMSPATATLPAGGELVATPTLTTETLTPELAPNGPTPSYLTSAELLAPENIAEPTKVVRLAGFY